MHLTPKVKTGAQIALLCLFVYQFQTNLLIEIFKIGAYFNNPYAKTLLGDRYHELGEYYDNKAAYFHQSSFAQYQAMLMGATGVAKGRIEYIIGTYYRCGRSRPIDPIEAKKWFTKARDDGMPPAFIYQGSCEDKPTCKVEVDPLPIKKILPRINSTKAKPILKL